ncbi:MAG: response regulator, partial [Sphingobacteriales bacterium]
MPVILFLVSTGDFNVAQLSTGELQAPVNEIIIVLNFATIVTAHFLFSSAFSSTISKKAELNNQLKKALAEAEWLAESKTEFLSTMSHELRTPLNSVLGITELLQKDAASTEETEKLEILKYAAENLRALINDTLDFNKLESGKLALETISVNLADNVKKVVSALNFQVQEKNISLILDMDETLNGKRVLTDPTRLSQILNNLVGNAIKFTQQGMVAIQLQTLSADAENIQIRFAVKDTGIGIGVEQQELIFEPFVQASDSTTRRFGGTGLGLAIVKQLLIMFSSSIQVNSTPGEGSVFYFDISFRLDTENQTEINEEIQGAHDLSGLRILVADDNAMNRLLLAKIFDKWNNKPVFVFNGQEAVEKLQQHDFEVILMDVHMPEMD